MLPSRLAQSHRQCSTSSFVMAAVQVVQLPPAFWGEQAVYGPHYRGGLAPPPDWWAQAAQACALNQHQVAALQQMFFPLRQWQTVGGFSYHASASTSHAAGNPSLHIPCTAHAWAFPHTSSPASTPHTTTDKHTWAFPRTTGPSPSKHANVRPHELTQEPSATFLGGLVRGSRSTGPL